MLAARNEQILSKSVVSRIIAAPLKAQLYLGKLQRVMTIGPGRKTMELQYESVENSCHRPTKGK